MKAERERLRAPFTEYNAKYFGGRLDYGTG